MGCSEALKQAKKRNLVEPSRLEGVDDSPAEAKRAKKRDLVEPQEPEGVDAAPAEPKRKRAKAQAEVAKVDDATTSGAAVEGLSPEDFRKKMLIQSTGDVELPDPVQSFAEAPFSKKVRAALTQAFPAPTAIQAQAWPAAVQGSDVVGVAKTGSGKTLGFLLPAFRLLAKQKPDISQGPAVLVLAPTRELVVQIEAAAKQFAELASVSTVVVYGGVEKRPQVQQLRTSPQLLVATPGRLCDLQNDKAAKLGNVQFLVLDEADRMLDMGFEPQMVQIMKDIPAERQTMLFSATWPKSVKKLAAKYLQTDFVRINVGETEELAANRAVSQEFFKLDDDEKDDKLWRIIDGLKEDTKVIVFANTKRRIDKLEKEVRKFGWSCIAMHGDKTQHERDASYADFVGGKSPLMFATDVCARGLDIKNVSHVINYDMARDVEGYVHRIGRTGRAGKTGTSITFVNEHYDTECAPALAKIAQEAGQDVPAWLDKIASKAKGGKAAKLWQY